MNSTFQTLANELLPSFEKKLNQSVSFVYEDDRNIIVNAIKHSVNSNGKRIRPLICMATEKSIHDQNEISTIIGVAVELIHCYSLIHDDLPAMDDDDFRRGQPTCHKVFGEDMAILAGDILNTYVFEYLSNELPKFTSIENTLFAINMLSKACSINGMAGGQVLDLKASSNQSHGLDHLQKIHSLKTGSILQLCFELPTRMISNDESIIQTMKQIGTHYGLLFQIVDDILDETAPFEEIGKSPGKDTKQNKLTYVSLLGIDGALKEALNHKNLAFDLMESLPSNSPYLKTIFNYTHEKGCQYVH